jgi:putative hydrolase of the HAD superfamily
MRDYTNYIFDLYGTLVDINTNEDKEELWKSLALHYSYHDAVYTSRELKEAYNMKVKKAIRSNRMTRYPDIYIDKIFRKLYVDKGVIPSKKLVNDTAQLFRILSTEYLKLYDGVRETLIQLKESGKRLYILSNGQRIFSMPELKYLGINDLFDGIYFSADIRICKPDSAFYKYLLIKEGLAVSDSIMIGNDHTTDIKGARNINMDSIYIHSNLSQNVESVDATHCIWDGDFKKINKALYYIVEENLHE